MDQDKKEAPEMLATRRSRRVTAGNRMVTVMAEVALDDTLKDLDDDVEFVNAIDEQDLFESDFESTDEEADKQVEETGEAEVIQEEKRFRKAARSKLEKATAAAHAKHRVTFKPDIQAPIISKPKVKVTSQMVSTSPRKGLSKTRTSKRMHTVLNTSATVTRLKEVAQKRAAQPKKARAESRAYTQAELIALALDTEEGNIREHRDYLKNEEEKRKRARVVRTTIQGPKLRWVSKIEDVKIVIPPPVNTPPAPATTSSAISPTYRSVYGPPGTLFTPTTYTYSSGSLVKTTIASTSSTLPQGQTTTPSFTLSQYSPYQYQPSPFPVWPPATTQQQPYYSTGQQTIPAMTTFPSTSTPAASTAISTTPSEPGYRTETVTRNYLVHEVAQHKTAPKPSWAENMQAIFGDHVKWDEIRVFVGRNRPLSRPVQTCPITGRPAHYLDPRTGVPYADSHGYRILGQLLKHEYVWNPSPGFYLGNSGPVDQSHSNMDDVHVNTD